MKRVIFHVHVVDNNLDCRIIRKDEGVGSVTINLSVRRIASRSERRVESWNQRWSVRDSIEEGTRGIRDAVSEETIVIEVESTYYIAPSAALSIVTFRANE